MEKHEHLSFRKGDFLAIALVVLIGVITLLCFFPQNEPSENNTVQIFRNGQLLKELSLQEDQVVFVEGKYHNTITIQNGRVAVTESNCPGRDCVHSGWSDDAGRVIVCLPNRVEIRIVGSAEVDFVVR